ncbi:MAG: hypothetical protein ACRC42_03475 [Mycoplasma sp.]
MATKWTIKYKEKTCNCFFEGYLSHTARVLLRFMNNEEKVKNFFDLIDSETIIEYIDAQHAVLDRLHAEPALYNLLLQSLPTDENEFKKITWNKPNSDKKFGFIISKYLIVPLLGFHVRSSIANDPINFHYKYEENNWSVSFFSERYITINERLIKTAIDEKLMQSLTSSDLLDNYLSKNN